MKGLYFEHFQGVIELTDLPDPDLPEDGVIIAVEATGLCRSDWHGWMGHDSDVRLPHVPGHEFAGTILEVGPLVRNWSAGDRVTVPFCLGCGTCPQCHEGQQQICDHYYQPGFTGWGSFAQYVALPYADQNLVRLPDQLTSVQASVLGCRFITSYRGVIAQGRIRPGQWLAVHGCGGVGLSAILIGVAAGAQVIAVDIDEKKLALAGQLGAQALINARKVGSVPAALKDLTGGGVHCSVDALGSHETCANSILSLRKRGKHIQIGLMAGNQSNPPIPMGPVIANELEIIGSHGMQAHRYPEMFGLIESSGMDLEQLIGRTIGLGEAATALPKMNEFAGQGVTIVRF